MCIPADLLRVIVCGGRYINQPNRTVPRIHAGENGSLPEVQLPHPVVVADSTSTGGCTSTRSAAVRTLKPH